MANSHSDNKAFGNLMKKSRLDMPFDDFDQTMMIRILAEAKYKGSIIKNGKLSVIFFLLGICVGIIMNNLLLQSEHTVFGVPPQKILLPFQVIFVVLILAQFERIYLLYAKDKNTRIY